MLCKDCGSSGRVINRLWSHIMIIIEEGRGGNEFKWLFEQEINTSDEGSPGRDVNWLWLHERLRNVEGRGGSDVNWLWEHCNSTIPSGRGGSSVSLKFIRFSLPSTQFWIRCKAESMVYPPNLNTYFLSILIILQSKIGRTHFDFYLILGLHVLHLISHFQQFFHTGRMPHFHHDFFFVLRTAAKGSLLAFFW